MCIDAKMPTESKCKANENASMNSVHRTAIIHPLLWQWRYESRKLRSTPIEWDSLLDGQLQLHIVCNIISTNQLKHEFRFYQQPELIKYTNSECNQGISKYNVKSNRTFVVDQIKYGMA